MGSGLAGFDASLCSRLSNQTHLRGNVRTSKFCSLNRHVSLIMFSKMWDVQWQCLQEWCTMRSLQALNKDGQKVSHISGDRSFRVVEILWDCHAQLNTVNTSTVLGWPPIWRISSKDAFGLRIFRVLPRLALPHCRNWVKPNHIEMIGTMKMKMNKVIEISKMILKGHSRGLSREGSWKRLDAVRRAVSHTHTPTHARARITARLQHSLTAHSLGTQDGFQSGPATHCNATTRPNQEVFLCPTLSHVLFHVFPVSSPLPLSFVTHWC